MLGLLRNFAAALAEIRTVLSAPLDDGWELDGGQMLAEREAAEEVTELPPTGACWGRGGSGAGGFGLVDDIEPASDCGLGPSANDEVSDNTDYLAHIDFLVEDVRNFLRSMPSPAPKSRNHNSIAGESPCGSELRAHNPQGRPSSSAAFASSADESAPARLKQTGSPGPSNLTAADLRLAGLAAREAAERCTDMAGEGGHGDAGIWDALADKLYAAAKTLTQ